MVEKLKDEEDRKLEALFGKAVIQDDGFSAQIVARVRRRLLVRRFSLPVAFAVGILLAAKPVFELSRMVSGLLGGVPAELLAVDGLNIDTLMQAPTVIMGAALFAMALIVSAFVEEA